MNIANESVLFFLLDKNSTSERHSPTLNNSFQDLPTRHLNVTGQIVISVFYVLGIFGNSAALGLLFRSDFQPRNPRHALMLRCLASNDLVAVLGMVTLMYLQLYLPALAHSLGFCRLRVFWRVFGLGSGCVAIVMAVERWCALTRPFFYQKHITTAVIRRSIFSLWTLAFLLVCLPFFGFGLYFEPRTSTCVRYRMALHPVDMAYAYLFLAFGLMLCLGIVWCNLAVTRALCHSTTSQSVSTSYSNTVPRRTSRNQTLTPNDCTREELAFARLMALFCVVFVLCWMPQMMSIIIAQIDPDSSFSRAFFRAADILILLHFCLDPYLYVLQRWPYFRTLCSGKRSKPDSAKPSDELNGHQIQHISNKLSG